MVGLVFLFFVAPFSLLAVFGQATAFNQDVSNWDTSAVITMFGSKCTLSHTPSAVVFLNFECPATRVSSDHNSHTFCNFCFV